MTKSSYSKMVYAFRDGTHVKANNAQEVGEELERLSANNESFGPKTVVKAAKNVNSPLHPHFDWDKNVAAEKWNLQQASMLIGSVIVVQEEDEDTDDAPQIRAFVSVDRGNPKGSYVPIGRALATPKFREQMIIDAAREMEFYSNKYRVLSSIKEYWNPLKQARGVITEKSKKVQKEIAARAKAEKKKITKPVKVKR